MNRPVYVITDTARLTRAEIARQAAIPYLAVLLVVLPPKALLALLLGLAFGWPSWVIAVSAVLAAPMLAAGLDLLAARVGLTPVTEAIRQIIRMLEESYGRR